MTGFIKEVTPVRIVDFMGARISLFQHEGTHWIAPDHIKASTGVDVGPVHAFGKIFPDLRDRPSLPLIGLDGANIDLYNYYSSRSAREALSYRVLTAEERDRVISFINLLAALQISQPLHSHTMIGESDRLTKALRSRPHWRSVLDLWNMGKTEGEISLELDISVTKVRSAVLSFQAHGFEVLTGEARALQKELNGRAYTIPAVTTHRAGERQN